MNEWIAPGIMAGYQSSSTMQGRNFESLVEQLLIFHDWTIVAKREFVEGCEVDITATDPFGQDWWIECKGSHRGVRQGLKRTDTLRKAIAGAWYLKRCHACPLPIMLVTSHMPPIMSIGGRMLALAEVEGIFDRVRTLDLTDW